jgi:hypothetical protein
VKPFRTHYVKNPKLTATECDVAILVLNMADLDSLQPSERRVLERAKQKLAQAYIERSK